MTDLQTLLTAVDHLNWRELAELEQAIELRRKELDDIAPSPDLPPELWGAKLDAALAGFWEGTSDEEKQAILAAMREKNIQPEDPELFAWLDRLAEDER